MMEIFSPPPPPAAVFGTFVKTQVAVAAWIYFWVFCSVASVCVSVFMQVPRCSPFVTVAAWCNLMSGTETPPALLFLLCLALLSQSLLCFHVKSVFGILMGDVLNLQTAFVLWKRSHFHNTNFSKACTEEVFSSSSRRLRCLKFPLEETLISSLGLFLLLKPIVAGIVCGFLSWCAGYWRIEASWGLCLDFVSFCIPQSIYHT